MAQFSTVDPRSWDAFYSQFGLPNVQLAPPPTQPLPLSWGTIQVPSSSQGVIKTADPLAGRVPLGDPNYRPPNENLPYNGNSIQMFDPFKPEIDQSYLGNLPFRSKQPTAYSPTPMVAPPMDVISAFANADVKQPPPLQAIEVADLGPPLPRPRPNTRFDIPLPLPSPLVPNIPPRAGTPVPPMPIPSFGAPVPAPRLARAPTPMPPMTRPAASPPMTAAAPGKYPVGFTGSIGNGSVFTMFPDGKFHKMLDGHPLGSGGNSTLLGSLLNHGLANAQTTANSGGFGGLLGLLTGNGSPRPARAAPARKSQGNGGGSTGGVGTDGFSVWAY